VTWSDVIARSGGSISAALVIEGMPFLPTSGSARFSTLNDDAGPEFPVQLYGALVTDGLAWTYAADIRNGDPAMSGICFQILDLPMGDIQHYVTSWMSCSARAASTPLTSSATAADVHVHIDSTAIIGTPAPIWIDQEAIWAAAHAHVPEQFTNLTRGIYFSRAVPHECEPYDEDDRLNDQGLEPLVYNMVPSWIGRRVRLYIAEILPNGQLDTPDRVWNGRIKTAPRLLDDGVTWAVDCEHLWDAQDTKIMSTATARTVSRLINLGDLPQIGWMANDLVGDGAGVMNPRSGVVTMATTIFDSLEALVAAMQSEIEAEFLTDAAGVPPVTFAIGASSGFDRVEMHCEGGTGDWALSLWSPNPTIKQVLGGDHVGIPRDGSTVLGAFAEGFSPAATIFLPIGVRTWIDVDSVADFVAFNSEGSDYQIRSLVSVGGVPCYLIDVDAVNVRLQVEPIVIEESSSGSFEAPSIDVAAGERCEIVAGLMLLGRIPTIWYQFMVNASVPEQWRMGLSSADYDWSDILLWDSGGISLSRCHILLEPTSWRDLLLDDMRFAGLIPTISPTNGLLSVRPLSAPTYDVTLGSLDTTCHDADSGLPTLTPSADRIVTGVNFIAEAIWQNGRVLADTWKAPVINRTLQQQFGLSNVIEIAAKSLWGEDPEEFASWCSALASVYFQIFGAEALTGTYPCTIRAAGVLPGDVVTLSHPTAPDPRTGTRGVTNLLAVVTSIRVSPWTAACEINLYASLGARRSGWAPSARCTDYVDNGAGAGDEQHALVLGPMNLYSADNEGLYFLAGMQIHLSQWDVDAPVNELLSISPAGHNAAGTTVYVTAAPVSDPGALGGTWIIYLAPYDTAGQTVAAKAYVHCADSVDNEIGATTDLGFKPS
jgi:hypothetical protein